MRYISILVGLVALMVLAGCGSSAKIETPSPSVTGRYNIAIGYVDVAPSGAKYTADLYDTASITPHLWHMVGTLSGLTLSGTATPPSDPAATPRPFTIVFSPDGKTFTLSLGAAPSPTVWTGTKA